MQDLSHSLQRKERVYRRYAFLLPLMLLTIVSSGCSFFNNTRYAELLGREPNLIDVAYEIAEGLEQRAYPPLLARHPEQPILTTTFVNNDNLEETSRFSRVLQEHLTSRFVQMGYTVREVKLRNELQIEPRRGEKILSRNLHEIQAKQKAQAVSVGTYSLTDKTIYISARLINPGNSNIISSIDYKLPMDKHMLSLFGRGLSSHETMDPIEEPKPSLMTRILY